VISLSPLTHALLALTALGAGFIDAIAGGGGVLTVPALLAAGLPPQLALGTNKGQSVFGSATSLARYARSPLLDRRQARFTFPLAFVGSLLGARGVLWMNPALLRPVVIALLMFVAVFLAVRRDPGPGAPRIARGRRGVIAAAALGIGAYDGFFGPGTGTFLIALFVAVLGKPLDAASADAKAVNFASNLAAVLLFASSGVIVWSVALPMAAAQVVGAWLGAHVTVRGGAKVVRPAVLAVVAVLIVKLVHDVIAAR